MFQPGRIITVRTILLAIALLIAAIFIGYYGGHKRIDWQTQRVAWLESQTETLYERLDRLEYENNILQVELDVERAATRSLQDDLRDSIEDKAVIARELTFYQRVMAPELDANGVAIDSFVISEATSSGNFYFRLILLQLERAQQLVTGSFSVQLTGQENNETKTYNLLELAGIEEGDFAMNYFALSEGTFRLPENFVPNTVTVRVQRRRGSAIDQIYQWQELLAEDVEIQDIEGSGDLE
ncbi:MULTISPECIES: DUF6776 family protein [Gammaproteobacteria]|uniref:DUF6776 family protein n=1 Tax=Gammaproteobacteria TaxID=1236 RepID=UPI000DD049F3|nr:MULTISPECIES: DUF6776 family protein [Gammaproteobacteria]RTE85634.1 hypothetical protein DQX04_12105 [Aliidiomarina sp. B3213]TCZ89603.1 hypothetical protein EYQ95_12035 [Lysobacter sp. N42]